MLTTEQFMDGSKTVTRRLGWRNLERGDILCAVKKGMGLKRGEKVERLGEFEVLAVTRERLYFIAQKEVEEEGFPDMSREEFIKMFCRHMKCDPGTIVTRIEFKRL
ncbi:MAG: hypothetical protein QM496_02045 [Verrucomicrobiota bacterium]